MGNNSCIEDQLKALCLGLQYGLEGSSGWRMVSQVRVQLACMWIVIVCTDFPVNHGSCTIYKTDISNFCIMNTSVLLSLSNLHTHAILLW